MPQISRFSIHKDVFFQIQNDIVWILSAVRSTVEMKSFYHDFFTKTERIMLAKRLAVAIMLTENFSYRDIQQILHVSTATISRIANWLDQSGVGVKQAIAKIKKEEKFNEFLTKVNRFLEKRIFHPDKHPFD